MNLITVSSTNISSIGYENGTLYIKFKTSGIYAYDNVPQSVYEGLMSSGSHGKYFRDFIKGRYTYRRIG